MSERWFDRHHFDIEVGVPVDDDLAQERIAEGDPAIVHIGRLLVEREFPFTHDSFTEQRESRQADIAEWSPEQCREYGSWIQELIESASPSTQPVTEEQLRRMGILGLGMGSRVLKRRLGIRHLSKFRQQLDVPLGKTPYGYADWDLGHYVAFARQLSIRVGGKLNRQHIDTVAESGDGPTLHQIWKSPARSIDNLNELIGFPDPNTMDNDDMIFWGVKVMRANVGRKISDEVVILSGRDRGPGHSTIRRRFGSFSNFKDRVAAQFELDFAYETQLRNDKLELYGKLIETGDLPSIYSQLSEEALMQIAGRYAVIDACIPWLNHDKKIEIAESLTRDLASEISRFSWQTVSCGYTERKAVELGVFNDIWPMDEGLETLIVSDEELAAVREKHASTKRDRRNRESNRQDQLKAA